MVRILLFTLKLMLWVGVSMAPAWVAAHEIRPSVADVVVDETTATIQLRTTLEPIIAGINMAEVSNTNDSPLAGFHDQLRALPPGELRAQFDALWPTLAPQMGVWVGGNLLNAELVDVVIPEVGDVELPRDAIVTFRADLPDDGSDVIFGWNGSLGPIAVRQVGDGATYETLISSGGQTDPMPRIGVAQQAAGDVFGEYLWQGVLHIIPLGLDHILFVLGLFFFSLAWRPLLWQVTTFTFAHTVTLALAVLGLVNVPGHIVEPLIAASIAYVALENIWSGGAKTIGWRRLAVVFAFGLLHGLGFASVFGDLDVSNNLVLKLVAFNIGVEVGQLAVILAAFLLVGFWFGKKPWYRRYIAIPGSIAIAVVGLWWTFERVFL